MTEDKVKQASENMIAVLDKLEIKDDQFAACLMVLAFMCAKYQAREKDVIRTLKNYTKQYEKILTDSRISRGGA